MTTPQAMPTPQTMPTLTQNEYYDLQLAESSTHLPAAAPMQAVDAMAAIDKAAARVANRNRRVVYAALLGQIPDRVLSGICAIGPDDNNGIAVLIYLTMRVGRLVSGEKDKVFDPSDRQLQDVATAAWADVVRERLRRNGILSRFVPRRNPFEPVGDDNKARVTLSDKLPDYDAETRQWLDFICARP